MSLSDWTWIRLIPLFHLILAAGLLVAIGVLRWDVPRRWVAMSSITTGLLALFFTLLALFALVTDPGRTVIVDPVAGWIGMGVGSEALGGGLSMRFDPLSAVFSLLTAAIGFLIVLYAVVHMRSDERKDGGYARFFGFMALQMAAMLIFVLADNLLLMLLGFACVVVGTQFLMGFFYADEPLTQSATVAGVAGLVGLGGLLFSVVMAFRGLAQMGRPGLSLSELEVSLPALAVATVDLPGWLGGSGHPLPEVLALGVGVAALAMASQWPLAHWLPGGSRSPLPAFALIQTVTTLAAAGYLVVRFSPWLQLAPIVSNGLAWLGALSAVTAALVACTRFEITRVLAWSSVSQFGIVLLAAGAGGYTAAVFHVVAHSFSKGLLLMAVGVVVLAMAGEYDMRKMGNIGSRLSLTRIDLWIGVFALAGGLPLTAGFFSIEETLEATVRAETLVGGSWLYAIGLITLSLTSFYLVRLVCLSLYGQNRLSAHVHWEEIQDPEPRILWPMGIMAALAMVGSVIGFPQIWADLLFGGEVQNANSLENFLEGVVASSEALPRDAAAQWSLVGQATLMSWLGAVPAVALYLVRPDLHQRLLSAGWHLPAGLMRPNLQKISGLVRSGVVVLGWLRGERPDPAMRKRTFDVRQRFLQIFHSGFLQHYLGFVAAGSFVLLLYFLIVGGG